MRFREGSKPQKAPSTNTPAKPSTAKQPGPADLLAMRAEQQPPEWVFRRPGEPVAGSAGLIVLENAARAGDWVRPLDAPVVALVGRSTPARRAALAHRLGLIDPVTLALR